MISDGQWLHPASQLNDLPYQNERAVCCTGLLDGSGQRSGGVSPVRFAIRANIRGPISSLSKCEDEVWPSVSRKRAMGARLPLDCPAYSPKRRKNPTSLRRRPGGHAAWNETLIRSGSASPCSRRSARTRRASACTRASACSRSFPYAITPDRSGTSATHRPSSSCSRSTRRFISLPCYRCPNLHGRRAAV